MTKKKEKENDKYNELAITINCCGVHQMFLNYSVKDTPNPLSPHPSSHVPAPRVDFLASPFADLCRMHVTER